MFYFSFEEQNNSSGAYVRSREINKLTKKQKGEWFSKRMSRSFDDDALTSLYTEEHKNDSLKSSRKGLTTLPLDDLLKQSEVLARYFVRYSIKMFMNLIIASFLLGIKYF